MKAFFDWLDRYNRREQTILLIGGVAVVLYILWKALLVPLADWRDSQARTNVSTSQSLGRVELLAAQLEQARRQAQQGGNGGSNLSALVDSSLRANNLSMSGFQPGTGGQVRVRLDEVPYDRFMQWLHDMEYQHGVSVVDFSMAGTSEQGRVTVNIRLQQN
ncbi:type II secretion system protein GspM [Marinimicrobium sp. ARAG 43.8]|uniref:type II secretion system protein GspM n=1 Tax=Marinimicrobium sp. ARAG 43.8 TaxID=3418719 RepID=UPI003CEBB893